MGVDLIAVLVILLFALVGYWRGAVRELIGNAALILAYFLAVPLGNAIQSGVGKFSKLPLILNYFLSIAVGGLIVILIVSLVGVVLTHTSQEGKTKRKIKVKKQRAIKNFGFLLGGIKGFIIVAIVLWVIISLGDIASLTLEDTREENPVAVKIQDMGGKVKGSGVGKAAEKTNPVPHTVIFSLLDDIVKVSNDPEALERFKGYPGISKIGQHPKIVALANDNEVKDAIQKKEFRVLLDNEMILAVLGDAQLVAEIKKINIRDALNYALQKEE